MGGRPGNKARSSVPAARQGEGEVYVLIKRQRERFKEQGGECFNAGKWMTSII